MERKKNARKGLFLAFYTSVNFMTTKVFDRLNHPFKYAGSPRETCTKGG